MAWWGHKKASYQAAQGQLHTKMTLLAGLAVLHRDMRDSKRAGWWARAGSHG